MLKRGLALIFKNRDFGLLMAAQFAAQAGDGIVQTALGKFIVFGGRKGFDPESARSPDEVLRIALYIFVPYAILSPFLGVLIDRWNRRRLLFVANGLRGIVVLLIGLVGISAIPQAALFLAFVLTLASTRLVLATKSAALPATLGESHLVEGNAVSQLGGAMFQIGGAVVAIGGSLVLSARWVALVGALVYLVGAVVALRIRHAEESRPPTSFLVELSRVLVNIAAGIREVARSPKAGSSIATYFWLRSLWSFTLTGIAFVSLELLKGAETTRLILTGGGGALGAALGFLLAGWLSERVRTRAMLVVGASLTAGLAVAALGGLGIKAAIIALTFFLGFGFFLGKISLDTMVQEALGDDFRGRAFSLYDISYNLAWVFAAGVMKLWWSPLEGTLISLGGVVFLLGLAGIALWYRRAGLLTAPAEA
ncbi:MAG TPA: MFS transporter [Actinomycetota bacterium]|nr:MFS transporter [Actinomycetota bacterium]